MDWGIQMSAIQHFFSDLDLVEMENSRKSKLHYAPLKGADYISNVFKRDEFHLTFPVRKLVEHDARIFTVCSVMIK